MHAASPAVIFIFNMIYFCNNSFLFFHMPRYGKKAGKTVKTTMHKMRAGKLKSGKSGKKVTSRKQAIAIGLSEARKKGAKVPPAPKRRRR
jgi:hypothetical protein